MERLDALRKRIAGIGRMKEFEGLKLNEWIASTGKSSAADT